MSSRRRQPAGTPTGGRFASTPRTESTTLVGSPAAGPAHALMLAAVQRSGTADADLVRAARSPLAPFRHRQLERVAGQQAASTARASVTRVVAGQEAGLGVTYAAPDADRAYLDALRAGVGDLPDEVTARADVDRAIRTVDKAEEAFRRVRGDGAYRRVRRATFKLKAAEIVLAAVRSEAMNPAHP